LGKIGENSFVFDGGRNSNPTGKTFLAGVEQSVRSEGGLSVVDGIFGGYFVDYFDDSEYFKVKVWVFKKDRNKI
jgi:hypothetical protein